MKRKHCLITLSYTPLSCAQRRMKAFLFFQRYAPVEEKPKKKIEHKPKAEKAA